MKHFKKYGYWYALGAVVIVLLVMHWDKITPYIPSSIVSKQKAVECKKASDGSNTGFTTSGYWNPKACNPNT